jgi:phage shock protein A
MNQPGDNQPHENEAPDTAPTSPTPDPPASGYTDDGVPTLDHVRDKIEGRFATALGSEELARESAAGRDLAEQEAEREKAAKERLEQIRRSLGT